MKKYIDIWHIGKERYLTKSERREIINTRVNPGEIALIDWVESEGEHGEEFDYFIIYYPLDVSYRTCNVYPADDLYIDLMNVEYTLGIVMLTGELAERVGEFIESKDPYAAIREKDGLKFSGSEEEAEIKFSVKDMRITKLEGELCAANRIIDRLRADNAASQKTLSDKDDEIMNLKLRNDTLIGSLKGYFQANSLLIKERDKVIYEERAVIKALSEAKEALREQAKEIRDLKLRIKGYQQTLLNKDEKIHELEAERSELRVLVDGSVSNHRLSLKIGKILKPFDILSVDKETTVKTTFDPESNPDNERIISVKTKDGEEVSIDCKFDKDRNILYVRALNKWNKWKML